MAPLGGTMIVEAKVLNRDVGQLALGMPVSVKLEAFPFMRYGTIPGRLIGLSKDAVADDGATGANPRLIYQARISLDCQTDKNLPILSRSQAPSRFLCEHAAPGMATTTDIKTGERRIISFLLSPLQRRLAEAGREE